MSDSLAALRAEAAAFGIHLSDHQLGQFAIYQRELAAWNAHTNLTAITSDEGVRVRHFLDSLTVARVVDLSAPLRVIDVGTGAGFPGLALKIAFPHLHMALLEATGKKLTFLRHVCAQMGIDTGVEFIHQRETYDLVLARAVARLPILLEYLLPLARVGGRCVALKGTTAEAEAADSARALARLGGRLTSIVRVDLPGVDEPHYLVVVEKAAPTPPSYPRKPGIPSQRPL
jgi:16S rRNA (guanine527-N7)-methyltransferase